MKKLLAIAAILGFSAAAIASPAPAAAPADKAAAALAAACKDKKAGDMVKVDGKDAKCPEAAKK